MADGEHLATMNWENFKHLCRELFERVFASSGAEVKVTQANRDQGVDSIVFDPGVLRRGKIVIQARKTCWTHILKRAGVRYRSIRHAILIYQ